MLYRLNPVLPPRARSASALRALGIIEAAARHVFVSGDGERLLARHALDKATISEATSRVLEAAWPLIFSCPDPVAPLGSGRRFAQDGGGRMLAVVEAWAKSYLASLEGRRELPYDPVLRAAWDAAHPEWGQFLRLATGALSAADPVEAAREVGVWEALEEAISSDAVAEDALPLLAETGA